MAGEIPQPLVISSPDLDQAILQAGGEIAVLRNDLVGVLSSYMTPMTGLMAPVVDAVDRAGMSVGGLPGALLAGLAGLPSEKLCAALLPGSAPPAVNKGAVAGIYDTALSFAKERGPGAVEALVEDPRGKVEGFLKGAFAEGAIDPAACLARVGKALAFHSGMGLLAHGVSTVLSTQVLANAQLSATGLAAAIADLAGFSPAMNAIQSPFYDGYLRQPWTYNCNDIFRPFIPGPRDLLRMWLKARADPEIAKAIGDVSVKDNLAKHGYSDRWIAGLMADAAEEPNLRTLQVMMESQSKGTDLPWLRKKALLLGYEEVDADRIANGLLDRQKSYYVRDRISNALERVKLGLDSAADFAAAVGALKLPYPVASVLYELADEEADLAFKKQELAALRLQYSRDEIDDAGLDYGLEALGFEAAFRGQIVQIERLKRFHKVWRKTPTDKAREALAIYRAAFRAGLMTEGDYLAALALAGFEADAILLAIGVDKLARDKSVAGDLREWDLPPWRDKAVQGTITVAAYRARLVGLRFPERYLAAEVALAEYLRTRAREQRVQSRQVPTMERAFILGLVSSWALERTYEEAGWTAEEIAQRRVLVDELRDRERDLREKYGPQPDEAGMTKGEKLALAEWKYVNGEITAAELLAIYKALAVPPDAAEKRLKALTPLRG